MKLTLKNAQDFAKKNFKKMPEIEYRWNLLHSEYIIKAIKELTQDRKIVNKLKPLAFIHDLGKIKSEENHAQLSLEVLKDFELDETDKDCILNHGSSAKPVTNEGKIFRAADGLSMFYPKVIEFIIKIETEEEGKSLDEINASIISKYKRYLAAYADYPGAIEILSENFKLFNSTI